MIVRETTKAITDTTNSRDVAGAKAVKEMLDNVGDNVTLKPTTKVNVSGTLKNLSTYINNISETTANVVFNEKFSVEDISEDITITNTLNSVTLLNAYKIGKILFLMFRGFADSDYTIGSGEDWCTATITGLSLRTNGVTVSAEYSENDMGCIAKLNSNRIVFHTLPNGVSDDGASATATFVVLSND